MSDWGKVPREVFLDRRLKPLDVRVFGILCTHANGKTGICTRRQEAIAEEVDATRESVNRSLTRLVSFGYIAKKARGGMKRSLEYRVLIGTGEPGQLALFEQAEAPRQAKPKAVQARAAPKPKRDVQITSDVTREVTSVVTSEITSNEQTPVNRTEPDGSAAARVRFRADNDPIDIALLEAELVKAAGRSLDPTAIGLRAMTVPIGWIGAGCDLRFDVLPAVAELAGRWNGAPIRSWSYFRGAVLEARDRRIRDTAAHPQDSPKTPASHNARSETNVPRDTGGHHAPYARPNFAGGGGRFAAAAEHFRQQHARRASGSEAPEDFAGPVLLSTWRRVDG